MAVGSYQYAPGGVDLASAGPVAVGIVEAAALPDHLHRDGHAHADGDAISVGAPVVSADPSE
jgi:hypothetical protein